MVTKGVFALHLFLQVILAMTAVFVMLGVLWTMFGSLRTPIRSIRGTGVQTVISVRDNAADLEQTLKGLLWLRANSIIDGPILIVDHGTNEEGKTLLKLARKQYGNIIICNAEDMSQWITPQINT